ncbi:M48 family metallopeptidase [Pontivivens ytuae]|uniref:M48 family metallopeptidase n=1 Tax=Pontivivens ytuae TaxID=2789856 RepID=A0A7S9LS39_9RHOB|nr:M48 family metallopeptidase [Pontivivens ytuae]QPH54286.1 M48 family metallopeptidase [Pontivivens ytuae]
MNGTGTYFDGEIARGRPVRIALGSHSLVIADEDGGRTLARWSLLDMRLAGPATARGAAFGNIAEGEARLRVSDPALVKEIRARVPAAARPLRRGPGAGKLLAWCAAAAASFVLIVFVLVPLTAERLTPFITAETEAQMGAQVRRNLVRVAEPFLGETPRRCVAPKGIDALEIMLARLDPEGAYGVMPEIWDVDMVNAVALPGGHVIFFRELIDEAESAEEVAGVLAHEIGHVSRRDGLRLSLRAAGSAGLLSMVIGDFAGGVVAVAVAEQLLTSSYQREAEEAADDFAFAMLTEADVSTSGIAEFFARLHEEIGETSELMSHLASHPDLASRAAAAEAADQAGADARPILTPAQWQALRDVCEETVSLP